MCASARVVGANRRQLFHSCTHALTARASFLTRSQGARIGARGGLGATASTARRRGGGAARTTGSAKPRERGRPRGSTTAAAAMRRDAGDDDRARVDRREVRSKAMRYRSRVRFNRYRSIDRSVTGFSSGRRGPFMNVHERSMCPSRRRIAIFAWAIEVWVWAQRRGLERGGRGIVRRRRRRRRRRR